MHIGGNQKQAICHTYMHTNFTILIPEYFFRTFKALKIIMHTICMLYKRNKKVLEWREMCNMSEYKIGHSELQRPMSTHKN